MSNQDRTFRRTPDGKVILLCSDNRIRRHTDDRIDAFMEAIFPEVQGGYLLTDESSLKDFVPLPEGRIMHTGDIVAVLDRYREMSYLCARIQQRYNIVLPDGIYTTIVDILDQIYPHA